jgi:hypothetical protein
MIEKLKTLVRNVKTSVDDVAARALLSYEVTEDEYDQGLVDGTLKDGAYSFPSVNYLSNDFADVRYPIFPYTGFVERDDAIWVGSAYTNTSSADESRFIYKITSDETTGNSVLNKIPVRNSGNGPSGFGYNNTKVAMDSENYIYMLGYNSVANIENLLVVDPDGNLTMLDLPGTSNPYSSYYLLAHCDMRGEYDSSIEFFKNYKQNLTDDGGIWMHSYKDNQYYIKGGVLQATANWGPIGPNPVTGDYPNTHTVIGNDLVHLNRNGEVKIAHIDGTVDILDIKSSFASSTYYTDISNCRLSKGVNCLYIYCKVNATTSGGRGILKVPLNGDTPTFIPGYTTLNSVSIDSGYGIIDNDDYFIFNSYNDRDSITTGNVGSNGFITVFDKNDDTINLVEFHQSYTFNNPNYIYETEDNRILALLKASSGSSPYTYDLYELDPVVKSLTLLCPYSIKLGPRFPIMNDIDGEIFISEIDYSMNTMNGPTNLIRIKDGVATKIPNIEVPSGGGIRNQLQPGVTKTFDGKYLLMDGYNFSLLTYTYNGNPSYYILNENNTLTPQYIDEKAINDPLRKVLGSLFYHRKTLTLPKSVITGPSYTSNWDPNLFNLRNKTLDTVNVTANSIVAGGKEMIRKQ